MLNVSVNKGIVRLSMEGNLIELTAELSVVVHSIYKKLPEKARDGFKWMFQHLMDDPESSIWEPERSEDVTELRQTASAAIEELIKKLNDE